MSKLLSEEQIERLFQNHLNDKVGSGTRKDFYDANKALEASARTAFKHAFILLMPIIEKQNEALGELVHHCRDYALAEESFVIAMAVDKANDTIQETRQTLEKLGEAKSFDYQTGLPLE